MKKIILILFITLGTTAAIELQSWAQKPAGQITDQGNMKKGFDITLTPSLIRLSGEPGKEQTGIVQIWNQGLQTLTLLTEVTDVANQIDEQGKLVRSFLAPGAVVFSCAKWISVQEKTIVLKPDEHKEIHFRISPPLGVLGGKVAGILFRVVPIEKTSVDTQRHAVFIQPRPGVLVFYDIKGTVQRGGHLVNLAYEQPATDKPLKIQYEFENTGNADVLLSGTFYLLDQNKALVMNGDLTSVRTFPGDKGFGETVWKDPIEPGKYQLVVTLKLGLAPSETIVRELEILAA